MLGGRGRAMRGLFFCARSAPLEGGAHCPQCAGLGHPERIAHEPTFLASRQRASDPCGPGAPGNGAPVMGNGAANSGAKPTGAPLLRSRSPA